jgi:hypothetical protein
LPAINRRRTFHDAPVALVADELGSSRSVSKCVAQACRGVDGPTIAAIELEPEYIALARNASPARLQSLVVGVDPREARAGAFDFLRGLARQSVAGRR